MSPEPIKDQLYDPMLLAARGTQANVGGGSRHYQHSESPSVWLCPACGKENSTRRLIEGCEYCHSGEQAAKHVGVDPIVRKVRQAPQEPLLHLTALTAVQTSAPESRLAFLQWIEQAGSNVGPLAAFTAGWHARGGSHVADHQDPDPLQSDDRPDDTRGAPTEAPVEDVAGPAFDPALKQARTTLAALIVFKEQVMITEPEETLTGEWLTAKELADLIDELKGLIDASSSS